MMMKLNDAMPVYEAVKALMAKPMKARAAFALATATKELREVGNEFMEAQKGLWKKHGTDQGGGMLKLETPEASAAFSAELDELLKEEVEFAEFYVKLGDIGELEIEGHHVAALMPFVKDGE